MIHKDQQKNQPKKFDPVILDHNFSQKLMDNSKSPEKENPGNSTPKKSKYIEKMNQKNLKSRKKTQKTQQRKKTTPHKIQKQIKLMKHPENKFWIVAIDISKCYDSISHQLIRETIQKFIPNQLIKNFLLKYYSGNGIGIYQGDPLSPILFAFISHFILKSIQNQVIQSQMFADDLIFLIKKQKKPKKFGKSYTKD